MPVDSLPSPWKEFLSEIDALLKESLALHCIGGFAACYFYGLPRTTGDIDYYTAIPANFNLIEVAGGSSYQARVPRLRFLRVGLFPLVRILCH